ncbi:MAG TPA: histidine--tRNA ligase [Thermoanaerobaculia bacterium]|nr:histidine--tRNA ligase [Thermoanaerobaculia bacterium]
MQSVAEAVASHRVLPRLSRGFHDLMPQQMLTRNRMIETVRNMAELYGFVPINTPAIEYLDVLSDTGGDEIKETTFRVISPEDEGLGLRFDLTVSLARFIAQNQNLPRPFRRYQVSPVWRADKPDKGRFREFAQFDLDSVGVESEIGDTEVIAAMCDILDALGFGRYTVRFSNRALLNLLTAYADIPQAMILDVFRILDKLEKIRIDRVRLALTTGYVHSGDEVRGLGLRSSQVERIETFLKITSPSSRAEVIAQLRDLFRNVHRAAEEIDRVERISKNLHALGYGEDRVKLDLSIARGLAYYTGPVFETTVNAAPQFGSVFSGGRYDNLVTRFLGQRVPATGASLGVDRLLDVLEHLGKLDTRKATTRVLVATMDPELTQEYLDLTWALRRAGVPTELYLGEDRGLRKQLRYADQCDIPFTLLFGARERSNDVVIIKNMAAGRKEAGAAREREEWLAARAGQTQVPRSDLVQAVKRLLSEMEQAA